MAQKRLCKVGSCHNNYVSSTAQYKMGADYMEKKIGNGNYSFENKTKQNKKDKNKVRIKSAIF